MRHPDRRSTSSWHAPFRNTAGMSCPNNKLASIFRRYGACAANEELMLVKNVPNVPVVTQTGSCGHCSPIGVYGYPEAAGQDEDCKRVHSASFVRRSRPATHLIPRKQQPASACTRESQRGRARMRFVLAAWPARPGCHRLYPGASVSEVPRLAQPFSLDAPSRR